MLLKRAREEILLTKKEMLNYLHFPFPLFLHLKIKESLQLFNLYSDGDFINLINGSDIPQENINTEFELESSDEDDNCENDSSDDQTDVSDQFSFNSESDSEVADEQSSTNESE